MVDKYILKLEAQLSEAQAARDKLISLILLTDPDVDDEPMQDLNMKQWASFIKDFPRYGSIDL